MLDTDGAPNPENQGIAGRKPARLTVFASSNSALCKSFRMVGGRIVKTPSAQMWDGRAEVVQVDTAAELVALFNTLNSHQAVSTGLEITGRTSFPITTSKHDGEAGAVARTRKNFAYPAAAGWLCYDYDSGGMPDHVRAEINWRGGVVKSILSICPEIYHAAAVVTPSSSDGVGATGGEVSRSDGLHIWIRVADVSKSNSILQLIHARAWAAGIGWVNVSTVDGSRSKKSIIDTAVAQPERLLFEASPILGRGVTREPSKVLQREGVDAVFGLDAPDTYATAESLMTAAMIAAEPEAAQFKKAHIRTRAVAHAKENDTTVEAAERVITRLYDTNALADSDFLYVRGAAVRVGDILDSPTSYHRQGAADPRHGIAGGETRATLLLEKRREGDEPRLVSHSGDERTVWKFQRYVEDLSGIDDAFMAKMHALNAPAAEDAGQAVDPFDEMGAVDADTASEMVAETLQALGRDLTTADATDTMTSKQSLIVASAGVGKTRALVETLAAVCKAMPDFRILIRADRHELAEEIVGMLIARGVLAGVYYGADATDPAATLIAGSPVSMCQRDPEDRKAMFEIGGAIQNLCAGKDARGVMQHCQYAGVCGYKRQNLSACQVVLIAGDAALDNQMPAAAKRPEGDERDAFNLLVLDETSPLSWSKDHTAPLRSLIGDFKSMMRAVGGADFTPNLDEGMTLDRIENGLRDLHDYIATCAAAGHGLTASGIADNQMGYGFFVGLRKAIWRLMPGEIKPESEGDEPTTPRGFSGMTAQEIRAVTKKRNALRRWQTNVNAILSAALQGLEDVAADGTESAHAQRKSRPNEQLSTIVLRSKAEDASVTVYSHSRLKLKLSLNGKVGDDSRPLSAAPVWILDATAAPDQLREYFPRLTVAADIVAKDGPGAFRVQVYDKTMSYADCAVGKGRAENLNKQKENTITAALGLWAGRGRGAHGGESSLIGPMVSREYLEEAAPGLDMTYGHFGGVKGSNRFASVRSMGILGRRALTVADAERKAAVMMGREIPLALSPRRFAESEPGKQFYFEKRTVPVMLKCGEVIHVENEFHADPAVESIRHSFTNGDHTQTAERGRSKRRGVDKPLFEVIFSNVADQRRPPDVMISKAQADAMGGVVGVLMTAGVWPTSERRSMFLHRLAQAVARETGLVGDDLPTHSLRSVVTAGDLVAAQMTAAGKSADDIAGKQVKAIRDAVEYQMEVAADIVSAIDHAFMSGATEGTFWGILFDVSDFWAVGVVVDGRAQTLRVLAASAAEARARVVALLPEAFVVMAGQTIAGDDALVALGRVMKAGESSGVWPVNTAAMMAHPSGIWGSQRTARQDSGLLDSVLGSLSGMEWRNLLFIDSLIEDSAIRRRIRKAGALSDTDCRIRVFEASGRLPLSEGQKRRRIANCIIAAADDDAAFAAMRATFGAEVDKLVIAELEARPHAAPEQPSAITLPHQPPQRPTAPLERLMTRTAPLRRLSARVDAITARLRPDVRRRIDPAAPPEVREAAFDAMVAKLAARSAALEGHARQ